MSDSGIHKESYLSFASPFPDLLKGEGIVDRSNCLSKLAK